MRVNTLRVFVQVLFFGLLLGAASTANADAVAIASFSFNNLQITPTAGSVTFTPTAASARGFASNSLGETQDITNSTLPVAQAAAAVTFTNAAGSASATNLTASVTSFSNLEGCSCSASSFSRATFDTTFVISGGQGDVLVTISFIPSAIGQVSTDEFGAFAFASVFYTVNLNGVPVFSKDEILTEREGPNQSGTFQLLPFTMSRTFTLQYGVPNTLNVIIGAGSAGVDAVPEPATVVLMVTGLGFMGGVLKRKKKQG